MKSALEIKKIIEAYEASHAVEEYVVNRWHVWPLLKVTLCLWWQDNAVPDSLGTLARFPWLRKTWAYRLLRSMDRWRIRHETNEARKNQGGRDAHDDFHEARREVVVLTLSGRRVPLNGALFEIYSDPLVEELSRMGASTLVWEQGAERWPRHSKSAWISRRLKAESSCPDAPSSACEQPEPDWFADYQGFAQDIVGRSVTWFEIADRIDALGRQSAVFDRWLCKTGARFLFVVCWYDPLVMAATLAAARRGVRTIELQHGLQGNLHYAYSSWRKAPVDGYEVVPKVFWCWGKLFAEELKAHNPAFAEHHQMVAGGNLWLNRFRRAGGDAGSASDRVGGRVPHASRTILITLGFGVEPLLFDAIKASPASWKWLIRFHPAWEKSRRDQDELQFENTGHPGVDLTRPNSLLLYELLGECDAHVTTESTSALEALAFGVPSIIIKEHGQKVFASFIEQGLMSSANSGTELVGQIERAQRIAPEEVEAISSMFASNQDARDALRRILRPEQVA